MKLRVWLLCAPLCFGGVQLTPLSVWDKNEPVLAVDVTDGLGVVSTSENTYFLNLTNPKEPRVLDTAGIGGFIHVTLDNRIAYLGNGRTMLVFDLSDIRHIKIRENHPHGSFVLPHDHRLITLDNDNFFVLQNTPEATQLGGLDFEPLHHSHFDEVSMHAVADGDRVYVTGYGRDIQVIDIANPSLPEIAWSAFLPGNAVAAQFSEYGLLVALENYGLALIDLQEEELRTRLPMQGLVRDLLVRDRFVFTADGDNGVSVVQATGPASLHLLQNLPVAGDAKDLALDGDQLYVAAGDGGLAIFDIQETTHTSVVPWVADNNLFKTRVALNNVETHEARVFLVAYDQNGGTSARFLTLPPKSVTSYDAATFHQAGTSYSLHINSNARVYAGFLTFRTQDDAPSQTTGIPLDELTSTLVMGGANADEVSALVISLPQSEGEHPVTFTLIDANGQSLATAQRTLPAMLPYAVEGKNLFGMDLPKGATIKAQSEGEPLAGTFFVFDQEGRPATARATNLGGAQ